MSSRLPLRLRWTVEAASRLHFGLLSFGATDDRPQYGGVGLMIGRPGLCLSSMDADRFGCEGPLATRVAEFANRWLESQTITELPPCRLQVQRVAQQHAGLGTGTQLGLSVAAILWHCSQGESESGHLSTRPPATTLARTVGRGARSSIGTFGFDTGGLIFERGKRPGERIGELAAQIRLPESWRVVIFTPIAGSGLSGQAEQQAFASMPTVPDEVTQRLLRIAHDEIVPNARAGRLSDLGDAIYRYGYEAGNCFATQQGGPFANKTVERWIGAIRGRGVAGAGQSSWGPSVFAIVQHQTDAEQLAEWFAQDVARGSTVETCITPIANQGATVTSS